MPEIRAALAPEALVADHWQPIRCERGRRVIDINPHRLEVRYVCDKCKTTHTISVAEYAAEHTS
jgi:hypothetical protein